MYVAHTAGCNHCFKGFSGRIAILEVLLINDDIRDAITNGYINAINSRNNSFEFIFNLIETELKKEAEILNNNNNNKRLLRVLNNKKLL